ncbi:MAG TPA: efflux RND transporter periplasmic adaptor subunit [Gemmataceae bacterium]|nr:efflux RND transporter periplasmic adaptor subunit [Gemmataceae bacterium]
MSTNRHPHAPAVGGENPAEPAPSSLPTKHSLGWKIWQVLKTVQARLRFFVLLAAVGAVFLYWDRLNALYEKLTRPASAAAHAEADSEYFCPMHPGVVRDHPDDCPLCGMPLVPRKKAHDVGEALPAGVLSRVQLTPLRVAEAGIRTAPVEYRPLIKQIEAAGFVEFDETKLTRITNRISGRSRIDKLYVNVTDQPVAEGAPLALLYSPDLDADMTNLLNAHRTGDKGLEAMIRDRLKNWGIADDEVAEVLKTGKPITHVAIHSPVSGHVLRKYQLEGDYIEEGARLFDVADLSTVWIEAQVFEDELTILEPGLVVHAFPTAYPNREFTGKIAQIHPHLDAETRTLKVRFDLENPGHVLRPGMYATVRLDSPAAQLTEVADRLQEQRTAETAAFLAVHAVFAPGGAAADSLLLGAGKAVLSAQGQVLAVPRSAVIDTGARMVVYRQAGPNLYEGVEVSLGPRCGDAYPVLSGLAPGDRVATAGAFLIDAETNLSGAVASAYLGSIDNKAAGMATVAPADDEDALVTQSLNRLSAEDRRLAQSQRLCPITGKRLGSMGVPVKVVLKGRTVFLCCSGCPSQARDDEQGTLDKIDRRKEDGR